MRSWLIPFALGISVTACGGGESAPGPLRYTLDDMYIAPVPLPERQVEAEAKKEYDLARMEQAKTESDYNDVQTKLEIAGNETRQAQLTERSAQAEKRAADKSADLTRINNSDRELRTALLGRRAADAKVSFLKAKRVYLKKELRLAQFNIFAKEAKWQLEKARIAKAKNIRPAGFDYANFEGQYRDRSEAAQREKSKVDGAKRQADEKQKSWNAAEQEFLGSKGIQPGSAATQPGAAEGTSSQTPITTPTSTDNKAVVQ